MVYVITGASSGLGEALAIELGRRGHAVGLVARRAELLADVAARVQAAGGRAAWAVADVLDLPGLTAAVRQVEAELGPIDVMVANAGGGMANKAANFDAAKITDTMRLNYDGTVHAFATVVPAMIARGSGRLAAVSSFAGWRGIPPGGPYSAAKAAVTTLLEAYAIELAPLGVRVTTIHPGFVRAGGNLTTKRPLPFLVEPDRAGRIMADGLERGRREINFPWQMHLLLRAVRLLPGWVFEPLFRKVALGAASR